MAEPKARLLACPYHKQNPVAYSGCRIYKLSKIKYVKQHLQRKHQRPPYCPRCYSTFRDDEQRDIHVRSCQVKNHPPVEINGVSGNQLKILRKRSNSNDTVEKQYHFIWKTLFPDIMDLPTSIYLDEADSEAIFELEEYMNTEGVAIARNYLAHSGINWQLQANEAEIVMFQESVARGVLARAVEGFRNHRTQGVVDPPQPSIPALPPAGVSASASSQNNSIDLMASQTHTTTASSMTFDEIGSTAGVFEDTSHHDSELEHFMGLMEQQRDECDWLGSGLPSQYRNSTQQTGNE